MKVYHVLMSTYNSACFFLEQRLPITKVEAFTADIFYFWVGDEHVATYYEMGSQLVVYRDLNSNNRCYGKLH